MILGVDLGNGVVKTSAGITFPNKIKDEIIRLNKNEITVQYKGQDFTLGKGTENTNKNKYNKIQFKIALLTAIAQSTKDNNINVKIVLGVPVRDFNNIDFVENIKNIINNFDKPEKLIVQGIEKNINIEDVDIFPEAGVIFLDKNKFKNKKTLVIDIGYKTIDLSLWNGLTMEKANTINNGMRNLYEKIITKINDKYGCNLENYKGEFIIDELSKENNTYTVKQEKKDISFVNITIENYIAELLSEAEKFGIDSVDSVELMGGGAVALKKWLLAEFNVKDIMENAEFANANTFKIVGEALWQ